jgi:RNA polymerase sigma-70 factor (ECF subfamily)
VEPKDADLVQQTLCGNTAAYNALIQRYQRQVYNLAYRMLGNAEDDPP